MINYGYSRLLYVSVCSIDTENEDNFFAGGVDSDNDLVIPNSDLADGAKILNIDVTFMHGGFKRCQLTLDGKHYILNTMLSRITTSLV